MARMILDLDSVRWRCGQVPRQRFSRQPQDDRKAVTEWLPATVPGDVRADLLTAGKIRSLDEPECIVASQWVDDADWWYCADIEAMAQETTAVLEADGIDYFSSVWLDDQLLSTHQGMFARQSIVLPPAIHVPGQHELAVRIWGAGALPRVPNSPLRRALRKLLSSINLVEEYFPDRMATPKAQFSFGWDFSPRVLSTGIWDEIRLVQCRGVHLADVHVRADPLSLSNDPTPVKWRANLTINRVRNAYLSARVELRSVDGDLIPLAPDVFDIGEAEAADLVFDSPPLARWWPWDHGDPNLYRFTVRIFDEHGPVDQIETLVGVRTVDRERFPNGQPWRFTLNERPVFLRGANWVPTDILPGRATADDYARLARQARDAGVNFLRVWGGGIREKRSFWERCNTLGIMVMQEFPLACAFLDHYPRDSGYLSVLESEARGIVRALRNHPSLIAWCGGNEISPRRERRALRTIECVLQSEDTSRPWIPASPSQGDIHQWDVWHGAAPWQAFQRVTAPFMSEFGLQALPHPATVHEMFPSGPPVSLHHPGWVARKLQATKLLRYTGPLAARDLVATIGATQRTQAAALQAAIEAARIRREASGARHPCGGIAFWQFNEPWPGVSWSVIDRRGRPKSAYEMLLRCYQPLLVAALFQWRKWESGDPFAAEVWLVNDGPEQLDQCSVEVTLDGHAVYMREGLVVDGGSATRAGSFRVRLIDRPSRLELTCLRRNTVVARNNYDLRVYLPPRQPLASWFKRRAADLLLQIG